MTHVELLQLTDPHLFTDPVATLRGVPTWETFETALAVALARCPNAAAVVLTGDVAQDEAATTYERLGAALAGHERMVRAIPGNHDDPPSLRRVFGLPAGVAGPKTSFAEELDGWQLVGLDSHVGGRTDGELGDEQLRWLAETLRADRPAVVFVHHPPATVGTPWLDAIALRDGDALVSILAEAGSVAGVFHGHTHQASRVETAGIPIYGTPSTAFQFARGGDELRIDPQPPGFRVIELGERDLVTHVVRVRHGAKNGGEGMLAT